jgi:hypothetical protein
MPFLKNAYFFVRASKSPDLDWILRRNPDIDVL